MTKIRSNLTHSRSEINYICRISIWKRCRRKSILYNLIQLNPLLVYCTSVHKRGSRILEIRGVYVPLIGKQSSRYGSDYIFLFLSIIFGCPGISVESVLFRSTSYRYAFVN
ncbi:hypothetical protein ABZP36_020837 [Zizania latifolia]